MIEQMWLVWIGVALVLGAIEAATVDFIFLMLAAGALSASVAAAVGAPLVWQFAVFGAMSVLLLGVVRPAVKRHFAVKRDGPPTIGPASYVGRTAYVTIAVTAASGRVDIAGDLWSARSADGGSYQVGDRVRVVAIEGATALVTQIQDAHLTAPDS